MDDPALPHLNGRRKAAQQPGWKQTGPRSAAILAASVDTPNALRLTAK
jgi:hypothetical protein